MTEVAITKSLLIGERFAFSVRITESDLTFLDPKSVTLVLDLNGRAKRRLQFRKTGVKVITDSGDSTDSLPASITEAGKRIAWVRNEAWLAANMPEGLYTGAIFYGDSEGDETCLARVSLTVSALPWGRVT